MPVAVKIKDGNWNYGKAINLLLMRGGSFQTRHERILIVNSEQKRVLEDAGLVETDEPKEGSGKKRARKKNAPR